VAGGKDRYCNGGQTGLMEVSDGLPMPSLQRDGLQAASCSKLLAACYSQLLTACEWVLRLPASTTLIYTNATLSELFVLYSHKKPRSLRQGREGRETQVRH
jgi:hypothetical protein